MHHGELPYRDFWSNTFPGVFWWYGVMEALPIVPRALWNGAVIGLTSVFLSRLGSPWGGAGYAIACPLLHRFWDMGQAEHLVNLFVAGSLAVRHPGVSGALFGAAVLTKPVALLFLPLAPLRRLKPWGTGLAIVVGIWVLPYVLRGGLQRVWEDLVCFNLGYGSSTMQHALAGRALRAMGRWVAPLWPAAVAATLAWRDRRAMSWLLLALAAVVIQGKLFTYHWVVPLAPLMRAAGEGFRRLWRIPRPGRVAVVLLAAAPWCVSPRLASSAWYPALHDATRGVAHQRGLLSRDEYVAGFGDKSTGANFSAADQERAAAELAHRGCETALVWAFEPGLNYLSKVPCPIRYVADFPLTFPAVSARAVRLRDAHRARFIEELRAARPACVVVAHDDANPVEPADSYRQMCEFTEFAALLASAYEGPTRIGSYSVWSLR